MKDKYDYTSSQRAQKYTQRLDEVAQKFGYPTWRKFGTAILNGEISLEVKKVTTIKEKAQEFIEAGGNATIENQGEEGVFFYDQNEFIPFLNLGYNSQLGFFRKSEFPDQPT